MTIVPTRTLVLFLAFATLSQPNPMNAQEGVRGNPPLSEPRIPRVEKPWTEAQRAILEPREREGRVLGVWSTLCAST